MWPVHCPRAQVGWTTDTDTSAALRCLALPLAMETQWEEWRLTGQELDAKNDTLVPKISCAVCPTISAIRSGATCVGFWKTPGDAHEHRKPFRAES